MKRHSMIKKVLCSFLAVLVFASMAFPVVAGEYSVGDGYEMSAIFDNDEDAEVVITLTGDITLYNWLNAKAGTKYTINGQEYVMNNVRVYGEEGSSVSIEVGEIGYAPDLPKIPVSDNPEYYAVVAAGDVSLEIKNDIVSDEGGVLAYDNASVTTGGVEAGSGVAIVAYDQAEVVAEGDVKSAQGTAVCADGSSHVVVNGDVTGGTEKNDEFDESDSYSYEDGFDGVWAAGDAVVEVTGDVHGGDAHGGFGYAGSGIFATENSTVEVTGDVYGGNVSGGETSGEEGYESVAGSGVYAMDEASVYVDGNATGGNSANGGKGGNGITIEISLIPTEIIINGSEGLNVTVTGVAAGGEGQKAGSGLFIDGQFAHDLPYFDFLQDIGQITPALVEDIFNNIPDMIYYALMELNVPYDEIEGMENDILDKLSAVLEENAPDEEAIEKWTQEECEKVLFAVAQAYDEAIDDVIASRIEVFDVTVYGLESPEGTDEITASSPVLATILNAAKDDTNYIIKTEECQNGTVSADVETATLGDVITITPAPADGYEVDKVFVGDEEVKPVDGAYKYTVTGNEGFLDIRAEFKVKEAPAPKPEPSPEKPATGDNSKTALMILILAVALCTVVSSYALRRRFR